MISREIKYVALKLLPYPLVIGGAIAIFADSYRDIIDYPFQTIWVAFIAVIVSKVIGNYQLKYFIKNRFALAKELLVNAYIGIFVLYFMVISMIMMIKF